MYINVYIYIYIQDFAARSASLRSLVPGSVLSMLPVLKRIQGWKPFSHNTQATFAWPIEKLHHITKVHGDGHAHK